MANEVGKRIKHLRKDLLSLSQDMFGKRIHRDYSTIAKIESGKMVLSPSMLQLICAEFNVFDTWIKDGTGEIFRNGVTESSATCGQSFASPPRHPAAAWIPIPPEPNATGIDPAVQAMADIKEIFDSGDPILIPAIQANLHAFKRALLRERQFEQILKENEELKQRILKLEELCADLKSQFETLQAENRKLMQENNRLKSTYEAPDGDHGHLTAETDTEKKAM